jgi:hypothetical protein
MRPRRAPVGVYRPLRGPKQRCYGRTGYSGVSLIGATGSGWMCDRFNPRVLLFWYYGLRELSLVIIPFTQGWRPVQQPLTNRLFGRRDTPVIISWIFAAHQIGGALAAFGAGEVRSLTGDYLLAFMTSGLACLLASLLVLQVTRPAQRRCAV